jgi:hypothetical protein
MKISNELMKTVGFEFHNAEEINKRMNVRCENPFCSNNYLAANGTFCVNCTLMDNCEALTKYHDSKLDEKSKIYFNSFKEAFDLLVRWANEDEEMEQNGASYCDKGLRLDTHKFLGKAKL